MTAGISGDCEADVAVEPVGFSDPVDDADVDEYQEIQRIIDRCRASGQSANGELAEVAHRRLYRIARSLLGNHAGRGTLGPTALINEGYVKMLSRDEFRNIQNARHFYARFALCMKHVMFDRWRAKKAKKRGGGTVEFVDIDSYLGWTAPRHSEVDIYDTLESFAGLSERAARSSEVFALRFFGFMSTRQIALATQRPQSTIEADLRYAMAYLRAQFEPI